MMKFEDFLRGLMAGDFSRLAPLYVDDKDGAACSVILWFEQGLFATETEALKEAFTCACFNGCTNVAAYLLANGVEPCGGMRTGLNAFHWSANRGQLTTVELLIKHNCPLESLNSYGGTVLGCAVWSAIHEPKPNHLKIIESLIRAGARRGAVEFPTSNDGVDNLIKRFRETE
jgi:Ankyrin repeats (3 copies)